MTKAEVARRLRFVVPLATGDPVTDTFTRRIGSFLLIIGSLTAPSGPVAAQRRALQTYSLTDLGTLGGTSSEASAVNNLGDVVGSSITAAGVYHAFLYRNATLFDLGTLPGGTESRGTAINDYGDVVGYSGVNAYGPQFREYTQGFVWQNGAMRALGALYCPCSFNVRYGTSRAFAVSNSGSVAGDSQTVRGETFRHAFVWQENLMHDLGAQLNALETSLAYGINDINEVVGVVNNRAFLARDGGGRDVGVLPGHITSVARAVNNKGQVVGTSVRPDGISRAFLWDRPTMTDLGVLPGDLSSEAQAINVDGDIVGRSGNAGLSTSRAVLWREGAAIDLNILAAAPGWILSAATGINDVRQIVGVGVRDGRIRAFLLTPR